MYELLGHTPGHTACVAKGERGEYIYTGDAVIFGHDRCCRFDGDHVHEREPLRFALDARLGEDFDDITSFDLGQ